MKPPDSQAKLVNDALRSPNKDSRPLKNGPSRHSDASPRWKSGRNL